MSYEELIKTLIEEGYTERLAAVIEQWENSH